MTAAASTSSRSPTTFIGEIGRLKPLSVSSPIDSDLDQPVDLVVRPGTEQDLPIRRCGAQPRRCDHGRSDHAVVVPALEADPAERREPRGDADAEAEDVPAPRPGVRELGEPIAHRDGHPHRSKDVVVLEHRIVEEDHHPVAGEVLERAGVLDDDLAHRGVVLAQHAEDLLGLSRLAERREAAEIGKHRRRDPAVAREELLAFGGGDERRDLGREEPAQLLLLALDRPQQLGLPCRGFDLEVVEALARERGPDPGPEDLRVERLRQVVGGAHLDAAQDAVQLVDARDHDHRQVPQLLVRLDRRQRLVAVHLGHLDVEEHDADVRRPPRRAAPAPRVRCPPRGRRCRASARWRASTFRLTALSSTMRATAWVGLIRRTPTHGTRRGSPARSRGRARRPRPTRPSEPRGPTPRWPDRSRTAASPRGSRCST